MATHAPPRGSVRWLGLQLVGPGVGRISARAGGRMAVALVVPLAVGLATDNAQLGLIAALAAFLTALVEPAGGYRAHAVTYFGMAVANALIALIGAATADTVVAAGVAGFVIGLATGAIVTSASRISMVGPFPLLVFVVIQGSPPSASVWPITLAAFLGSLWVVAATLIPMIYARFFPLDSTVGEAFRALAVLAHQPDDQRRQLMAAAALGHARADLMATPGVTRSWQVRRRQLWAATEAGDRVLATMAALASLPGARSLPSVDALLREASRGASAIAQAALWRRRTVDTEALRACAERVTRDAPSAVAQTAGRLVLRLEDAVRALAGDIPTSVTPIPTATPRPLVQPLVDALRWGAPGLRHGVRLGIAAGGCMAVFGLMDQRVPFVTNHASWVTITLVAILAPSMGASVSRVLQRVGGTAIGALAAALIIWWVGNPWVLAAIAMVAAVVDAVILPINYAWFVAMFTAFALLVVSTASPVGPIAGAGRMAATLLACTIGLIMVLLIWPTRSSDAVPRSIADAIRAMADNIHAALQIAQAGGPVTDMTAGHRHALAQSHRSVQLIDSAAFEGLPHQGRNDPLADMANATLALIDQAATLGNRMPETTMVVAGTTAAVVRMEAVLRDTADDIEAHRAPQDPGDLTLMLGPARAHVQSQSDQVSELLVDALDGMLRATRGITVTTRAWVEQTASQGVRA